MGKVIIGATISLDGFMNDRDGDVSRLYPDLAALGETEMLQEEIRTTGAVVMGRRSYDMAEGDLTGGATPLIWICRVQKGVAYLPSDIRY